ncbi:hypothetical protein LAZ67_4000388 [Cordylochernes scorpioides]|uniref:Uncharacterized protein n=1 Tax=Cordylochernes scorpioides TaxID=51811 RepID=A0ABY6KG23_9ARAC|nr:hypothetical protein LAZ67_4000388 [Cordylochernes scorpioides]
MMSSNKPSGVKRNRSEMDSDPKHLDFKFGQISCAFNTGVNQINTLATKAKLNEDLRRSLIKTLHSALTCAELALQDAYTGINLAQSRPKPMAETPSRPSYAETADITKPPAPVSSKVKPTYNNLARDFESHVVIKSINPSKESREILREVKSKNPSLFASNEVAASVKGKGKLVIHTKTKHVAAELASKLNNAMPSELSCQEHPTIHPRYCIFGVEDSTKNEEILKSLENNPSFKNLPGKRHFRIAHRPKPNPKGYTTVFVEVDDDAAKTLQQRDKPPVERLLSHVPRTFVNCLNSEFIQKTFGRNECGRRHFQVGDKVLFTRVIQNRRKWFKAQVIRRLGYNVYLVKNLKGTFKVHVNQMRTGSDTKYAEDSDWTLDNAGAGPHRLEQDPQISTTPPPRRSTRPRCPPCRFSPTMNNIRKEE